jgi:hypothetical protein
MKPGLSSYSIALLALALWGGAPSPARAGASAESLFVSGAFDASDSAWARVLKSRSSDTLALVRRAQIALLRNRTAEARQWAERARKAGAAPGRLASLLAECAYRENRFDEAARQDSIAGKLPIALKLRALSAVPYDVRGPAQARIPFDQTDPLPLVWLRVNGRGPFLFLIDTGGGELGLDPQIADSIGARRYGSSLGTFAGDQKAAVEHASVDSVELGPMVVSGVPVRLLSTQRFAGVAGGRRVAGVLGTILLARFRFTFDYPGGALLLERRDTPPSPSSATAVRVPLWWASDHVLLARGSLGRSGPLLWFLDTGLAGAAFTAPRSTLLEAGITLRDTAAFTGQGGAGAVRAIPFRVDSLRLGPLEQGNLFAMLGPFPASLETSLGFRVAGIVSHAFLRSYRVTFDLERMSLTLERPS